MEDPIQALLYELCSGALHESSGEFQIDLVRAREKLEQNLGLYPADYLTFLIQGASALGARRLRLSSNWRSLSWEFDAPPLPLGQLAWLGPNPQRSLPLGLQKLQMALFLLSRHHRYGSGSYQSGTQKLSWSDGKFKLQPGGAAGRWHNRITLQLSALLDLHWLLSRRAMLTSLPEYNLIKPRLLGSPLHLELPFRSAPQSPPDPYPFALALVGQTPMPAEPPLPSAQVWRCENLGAESAWFIATPQAELHCLVHGLGYPQSGWPLGSCWIYANDLPTDLSQRQLTQGPLLQQRIRDVSLLLRSRLLEELSGAEHIPQLRTWALKELTRTLGSESELSQFLTGLALFKTTTTEDLSLLQLDKLYSDQGNLLYYTQDPLGPPPEEAPPIVEMDFENASILTARFPNMVRGGVLFDELSQRERARQRWLNQPVSKPELPQALHTISLERLGVTGQGLVGIQEDKIAAQVEILRDSRLLLTTSLTGNFPDGLLIQLEQDQLTLNSSWSQPVGPAWNQFLSSLWDALPNWLAQVWNKYEEPPEWLRQRLLRLYLRHSQSQCLEDLPLLSARPGPGSLKELRDGVADQRIFEWMLEGWDPGAIDWSWYPRLFPEEGPEDTGRRRLETFAARVERFFESSTQPIRLPESLPLAARLSLTAPERGELGVLSDPQAPGYWLCFRHHRLLHQFSVASPQASLPPGLAVAIEGEFVISEGWDSIVSEHSGWKRALEVVHDQVPRLIQELLRGQHSDRALLSWRLLKWLPRERWPSWEEPLVWRLDGSSVALRECLELLQQTQWPIDVLVECADWGLIPGFEHCWVLSRAESQEISGLFGPSRLQSQEDAYLVARLRQEQQSQGPPREARLEGDDWLLRQPLQVPGVEGEIGLRRQTGAANRWNLCMLRQGRPLFEYSGSLLEGPDLPGEFQLHLIADWPAGPSAVDLAEFCDSGAGQAVFESLRDAARLFAFSPRPESQLLEYIYERLAYEAGAREQNNLGFTQLLDEVRRKLIEVPVFPLDGGHWSMARALGYLLQAGRLGYVLGDPIDIDQGPIFWVNTRQLNWLRLLFGNSQLANLTHLRRTLFDKQRLRDAAPEESLTIPELDYVCRGGQEDCVWGLQRDFQGSSRIRVLINMRPVEHLSFDWSYQVQAVLNLSEGNFNTDGSLRRDSRFQTRIEQLQQDVIETALDQAPERYLLELGLWSWGQNSEWARSVQDLVILPDPRGGQHSLRQWVESWQRESALPYLIQSQVTDPEVLDLLPPRPVALLDRDLALAARKNLAQASDYRDGLTLAWKLWNQQPASKLPPATFHYTQAECMLDAELEWTTQTVSILWRERLVGTLRRNRWPGYRLCLDWSRRLLSAELPDWPQIENQTRPYFDYLLKLLSDPDLLDTSHTFWESLPIAAARPSDIETIEATGEGVERRVAQLKYAWQQQSQQDRQAVTRVCQLWLGTGCTLQLESDAKWPVRLGRDGETPVVILNPQHRWFRDLPVEVIALRLSYWLQRNSDRSWSESAALRLQAAEEFNLLTPPKT